MSNEEGNKLIAEFMGEPNPIIIQDEVWVDNPDNKRFRFKVEYHTSWDWVHEVITKIRSLWDNESLDLQLLEEDSDASKIKHLRLWCEIESAWQAVVQFIQWYNTQSAPATSANPENKKV